MKIVFGEKKQNFLNAFVEGKVWYQTEISGI